MADERIVAGAQALRELNRALRAYYGPKKFRRMQAEFIERAASRGGAGDGVIASAVVSCGDENQQRNR